MPVVTTSAILERVFIAPQTAFQTAADISTGKLVRAGINGCKLKANVPLVPIIWKTGTRSQQPGSIGRISGSSWSLNNLPVFPSGSAATLPDADALYQGIFGQAATGLAYSFLDTAYKPFTLARFSHGQSTVTAQLAYGCLVNQAGWQLNGDVFTMNASGPCFWVLDSENFTNETTAQKGGLSAFPAEPTTPTILGSQQPGWQGVATFDSNGMDLTTAPLIACSITANPGNYYTNDAFGTGLPGALLGGMRNVGLSCSFVDNDSAALNNLKTKAKAKTAFNVTIQVGTTTNSICTFSIKGIQLAIPDYSDDNARVVTAFSDSPGHASSLTAVDEFAITFS